MINKWILNNFKSIEEEKELELRPLTIFTGANSSGKSTILQSILLVTQTIQDQMGSRSIVLNGWFKKFGSYSDIVNKRDFNKNIGLGFSLTAGSLSSIWMRRRGFTPREDKTMTVNCNFQVSSEGMDENLHPILENMHLESSIGTESIEKIDIRRCSQRSEEEKAVIRELEGKHPSSDFLYSISTTMESNGVYYPGRLPWKYIGVNLFHFMPRYYIGYCTYEEQMRDYLEDYLLMGRSGYYKLDPEDEAAFKTVLVDKGIAIAESIYKERKYTDSSFEKYYAQIKNRFTLPRLQTIFRYSTLDGDEKMKYIKQLTEQLKRLPRKYVSEKIPIYSQPGSDYVREFFNQHIKYLGPLREEPKSLYPLETSGGSTDLGLKGENTAAVFENFKNKEIPYVSPRFFKDGNKEAIEVSHDTLAVAINEWLVYLGVARDINTNDRGKFGHELKITTDIKEMKQDLTHVGVGVSQILPILVLCFLSEKGETIILEQPELHLHPKVQTRLADFFVSMNVLGKQCIIETHSEYLINRMRLLVALSDDTKIADDTMIYFVEKDKEEGFSKYRQVKINKYGVIPEWPDGFFDEGEDLSTKIMKAGMEKKRREMLKSK